MCSPLRCGVLLRVVGNVRLPAQKFLGKVFVLPRLFFVGATLFLVQSALLGGPCGLGGNAAFGRFQRLLDQRLEFFSTALNILGLVAKFLRLDDRVPLAGHVPFSVLAKAVPSGLGKSARLPNPPQRRLGVNFVYVLPTWSPTPRERPLQLLIRNFQIVGDLDASHRTATPPVGKTIPNLHRRPRDFL